METMKKKQRAIKENTHFFHLKNDKRFLQVATMWLAGPVEKNGVGIDGGNFYVLSNLGFRANIGDDWNSI